jgi:hypothetical protein
VILLAVAELGIVCFYPLRCGGARVGPCVIKQGLVANQIVTFLDFVIFYSLQFEHGRCRSLTDIPVAYCNITSVANYTRSWKHAKVSLESLAFYAPYSFIRINSAYIFLYSVSQSSESLFLLDRNFVT